MADFEDEGSANLAPVNGLQDDASGLQHPSLGADPSHFSKLGDPADPYGLTDPYAQSHDPFDSQPSSMMAQQDYDSMGGYQGERDFPPANEAASGDFGQFQEDHGDDLPANFAREAARHQNFTEGDHLGGEEEEHHHPGMTPTAGRGDEADEVAQAANGSNPFAMDALNQGMGGGGGTFVDNNDRPIMGYNPFLNEENRGGGGGDDGGAGGEGEEEEDDEEEEERDGGHFDHSQDMDFYKQQSFGGPTDSVGQGHGPMVRGEDEHVRHPDYDRLEEDEDEDDADLQMEPVENIQQPPDQEVAEKEEVLEDRQVDDDIDDRLMPQQMEDNAEPPASFTDDQIHSDDTCATKPDESVSAEHAGEEFDARPAEPDFDQPGEVKDQTSDYQAAKYHRDTAQTPGIDFEKGDVYEDEQKEEEGNSPPQSKGPGEEEDLGIVNQAFSDDVDMDGGKVIPEEEELVQKEVPAAEVAPSIPAGGFEDHRGQEEEIGGEEEMEREEPIGGEEEKGEIVPEDKQEEEKEDEEERMEEQERPMEMSEEKHGMGLDETSQAGQVDSVRGDYSQDQLRSEEDDEEEITQKYEGKDFGSRLHDSDVLSSEHDDRSFVDNLSELASPDTMPQPLPSPPEPKDMSPFDPLAPTTTTNSVSPCHEAAGANLGQHGEFFEPGNDDVVADETNNTGDFLTAGEVEGETKFGVDGTAITQTATQNNAFLHSDDEEDDEEEEESQPLDQAGAGGTAGTTETETSVEDRSGEFGGQGFETMENNDNALMSMSMEGSFYDDGGELIGGDDRRETAPQENHLYQGGAITEESYGQHEDFEQKEQDSYLMNQGGFGQQIQNDYSENSYQQPSHEDAFGLHEDNHVSTQDAFDPLSNATAPPASAVNGVSDEGGNMGGLDSLLDAPVTEQGLQTPVTEKGGTADSSVDNVGIDSIVHEFESSVDSQPLQQEETHEQKSLEDALGSVDISESVPDKPEEPSSSSVDEPPVSAAKVEEQNAAAPAAAAAPDAGVAAAAAAAAPGTTKSTTTTTVKKSSSAKAGGKTTTTTTTKTTKETKTTANNNKTATTKKAETTTTTSRTTTPRKPATDSRPTSAATDKKAPAKGAPSPTKSAAAPAAAKGAGPLPSYAQPVTPRKPREAKVPTPEEKKKLTATPRLPSAGATRSPRPQSATAAATTTTTAASSTTKTATRTSTTTSSATTRTAQLARPKSSPTKLTNGTTSGPTDTKSTPKKYGIDARNEGYKPGGGNVKITSEKKEYKATSRIDAGAKGATPGASAPKPAAAKTSPRTSATPKTGEVKSKIGSMDNATHSPGGGNVKIANKKPDYANVSSKIGSKDKADHKPGGGNVKIENRKLKVEAKSKIGSLDNATHKPSGGDKKIESHKLDFKDKASPKIGSLDKQIPASGSEQGATEVPAANGATSDN